MANPELTPGDANATQCFKCIYRASTPNRRPRTTGFSYQIHSVLCQEITSGDIVTKYQAITDSFFEFVLEIIIPSRHFPTRKNS